MHDKMRLSESLMTEAGDLSAGGIAWTLNRFRPDVMSLAARRA